MSLTILFMPESAFGPTNNCVGIGDVLRRRGHRVVFAAEASWQGRLEKLGFTEDLVHLAPPPEAGTAGQDAGQFWKDFIRDTAPEFRKPTIEQLGTWIRPVWEELTGGARYCQPQLTEIVARARPDVIVEDNVVGFPALLTAGVPAARPAHRRGGHAPAARRCPQGRRSHRASGATVSLAHPGSGGRKPPVRATASMRDSGARAALPVTTATGAL